MVRKAPSANVSGRPRIAHPACQVASMLRRYPAVKLPENAMSDGTKRGSVFFMGNVIRMLSKKQQENQGSFEKLPESAHLF